MNARLHTVALILAAAGCSAVSYPDHCTIAGATIARGAANPQNACQVCQPQSRSDTWSEVAGGSPCGDAGALCFAGTCLVGCFIVPGFYSEGASNPDAPCESCQPEIDNFGWSPWIGYAPGKCPMGQYCSTNGCRRGCVIAGQALDPDAVDSTNLCRSCQPDLDPADWSRLGDGSACDAGGVCIQGGCQHSCSIGGRTYPPGALEATNPCFSCIPEQTTAAWSPISGLPDGGCDSTAVCDHGACRPGCFIDGKFAAPGADPNDVCLYCDPAASTSFWVSARYGTLCNGSSFCSGGNCLAGCFINGTLYPPGAFDPGNACHACRPDGCAKYDWSDAPSGTLCGRGGICAGSQCQNPPFICLPTGVACSDGGPSCCSSIDAGLLGGCSDTGICGCLPVGQYLGYNTSCLTAAPACCSTVCVRDNYDNSASCSCYDAGTPCQTDVQCCGGCCAGGFCN